MNFYSLILFLCLYGTKVHSMPSPSTGHRYVRSVNAGQETAPAPAQLDTEDRSLLYGDDIFYVTYDCGALYTECSSLYICCELSGAGYAVYSLVTLAIVAGIVACSCACCPCCPWYEKMCCAERARRNAAAVGTPVTSSVKASVDTTGTSTGTLKEVQTLRVEQ